MDKLALLVPVTYTRSQVAKTTSGGTWMQPYCDSSSVCLQIYSSPIQYAHQSSVKQSFSTVYVGIIIPVDNLFLVWQSCTEQLNGYKLCWFYSLIAFAVLPVHLCIRLIWGWYFDNRLSHILMKREQVNWTLILESIDM